MTPISLPLHLDLQAGDITCCNGGTCCISSTGGGAIAINHNQVISKSGNDQKTPNTKNNQIELEDSPQTQEDPISNSLLQEPENIPKNLLDKFFQIKPSTNKNVQPNTNDVQLINSKQAKKLTPLQNRTVIKKYYDENSNHYGPIPFAFLAAFNNLRFDKLYNTGSPLPVSYDTDIQNAVVTLKPLWPTTKKVVELIMTLSSDIIQKLDAPSKVLQNPQKTTKMKEKEELVDELDIEHLTISLPKNNTQNDTQSLNQFLPLVLQISSLKVEDLVSFRKKARMFKLLSEENKFFGNERSNIVPFKREAISELVKISSVIDRCIKQEKYQTIEDALEFLSKKSEEELELLVINN